MKWIKLLLTLKATLWIYPETLKLAQWWSEIFKPITLLENILFYMMEMELLNSLWNVLEKSPMFNLEKSSSKLTLNLALIMVSFSQFNGLTPKIQVKIKIFFWKKKKKKRYKKITIFFLDIKRHCNKIMKKIIFEI
jgi:hypothetical protein